MDVIKRMIALTLLLIISCQSNGRDKSVDSNPSKAADSTSQLAESETYKNYALSIVHLVDSLKINKEDLRILIDKSDYKLTVLQHSLPIKEYPVVFGTNPISDKLMEGDRSTPEGHFRIQDFYPHKSWSKFIWINYPTKDSWKKHNKAKSENRIPNDATIGGEIGIHGVPKGKSKLIEAKINWTLGCISMNNADVDDLYNIVYIDMKVEIVK